MTYVAENLEYMLRKENGTGNGHRPESAAEPHVLPESLAERRARYEDLLRSKAALSVSAGFEVSDEEINPALKPFTRAIVKWALRGGCRAIFASYGLHKTCTQLEIARLILSRIKTEPALIVMPLGVRREFVDQAAQWFRDDYALRLRFTQRSQEVDEVGIFLTNYESIREGKIDPTLFGASSLDEADVLRSFGSKTFSEMLFGPMQRIKHRFVATATPDPNEYLELLAYAHYLGIMDIGESKTRFFKRNSEKADALTLHPHKEEEFWLWVASWALFLEYPSDLSPEFSDEGYVLPELRVHWHEVAPNEVAEKSAKLSVTKRGQVRMGNEASYGVSEAAAVKRYSLPARVSEMTRILEKHPQDHVVIWHHLEDERRAIEKAVPGVMCVHGNQTAQPLEVREQITADFADGRLQYFGAKPSIAGAGCNLQRHCHRAIALGIDCKARDFLQALHRIYRFGQEHPVDLHVIYAESERSTRERLEAKWERDRAQRARMREIIRQYGLSDAWLAARLTRDMGVEREERVGRRHRSVKNDSVLEFMDRGRWPDNSVHLIHFSPPFEGQYEYTPNLSDFGHSGDSEEFFAQMDFLTPELFRVLIPGRVMAVHVKDRVVPGGMTGLGFQTIYPFSDEFRAHCQRHGFAFLGRKTIVTDVVRENKQTNRLGWTEQCKDGTKMGCGLPEYLLLFRKPPTDNSNGYGDLPVVKRKPDVLAEDGSVVPWASGLPKGVAERRPIVKDSGYSRGRWQFDAHGFMRSSGNRLLSPEDFDGLSLKQIFRLFRRHSLENVYDFERDVALADHLDSKGALRPDFMVLQPQSWHPDVWTDVMRARTMNTLQAQKGRVKHLCPLQFDIVDRVIAQYSMPDEVVLDPFAGLGTVMYRAVKLGRQGAGCELNGEYFVEGQAYLQAAEANHGVPSLFDLIELEQAECTEGDEPDDAEIDTTEDTDGA